jgi:hypothetical protein
MTLLIEWPILTLCSSATGWGGGMMFSSHVGSLGVDAIVSVSVSALGCVSTCQMQARIDPRGVCASQAARKSCRATR